jgi:putative tricarboxylic transport membrane protein
MLSDKLGFLICASTILMAMFWALGVKKTWIVPIAVLVTLVIHSVFYKGLRVPLPWGILMPLQW